MVRRHLQGLKLIALSQCFLLAWLVPRESFLGTPTHRSSRAVEARRSVVRHFKNAPEAEKPKDGLEDVWRYIGGWYEIKKVDGKLFFRENNLQGELLPQDDWLVAELPPSGTIRLKLGSSGEEVLSNFKPADADAWGDTITALREWESLTDRTETLKGTLQTATFEGTADGVTVTVDGRQRPVALSISEEAAGQRQLGALIREAHSSAVETRSCRRHHGTGGGGWFLFGCPIRANRNQKGANRIKKRQQWVPFYSRHIVDFRIHM